MDKQAAAARLGVSVNTLSRYVRQGRIAKYYPSGLMRPKFHVDDVDALMIKQSAGAR